MAVSGLPEVCDNHAKCIARLALDMIDMCKNVNMGPKPVVCIYYVLCIQKFILVSSTSITTKIIFGILLLFESKEKL